MNNVLTRIVLFEKNLCFSNYDNPYKCPMYLWTKISKEILSIECPTQQIEFISKNILALILKIENFSISPTMYNPYDFTPLKKIFFNNNLYFYIPYIELSNDISKFESIDGFILKNIICKSWDEKRIYRNI